MYVYISFGCISRTGTEEGDRILKKSSMTPGPSERGIIHVGFMLGKYPGGANLSISFAFKAKSFLQEQKRKSGRFEAYEILAASLLVWWYRAPHTRRTGATLCWTSDLQNHELIMVVFKVTVCGNLYTERKNSYLEFVWRRQWHPTPVLVHGKSHGQRSLIGCSPWGREELDMTERLHFHFSLECIGEGNGNPLQCSCLENPRDRGA